MHLEGGGRRKRHAEGGRAEKEGKVSAVSVCILDSLWLRFTMMQLTAPWFKSVERPSYLSGHDWVHSKKRKGKMERWVRARVLVIVAASFFLDATQLPSGGSFHHSPICSSNFTGTILQRLSGLHICACGLVAEQV
jgi:hypothetical protein